MLLCTWVTHTCVMFSAEPQVPWPAFTGEGYNIDINTPRTCRSVYTIWFLLLPLLRFRLTKYVLFSWRSNKHYTEGAACCLTRLMSPPVVPGALAGWAYVRK